MIAEAQEAELLFDLFFFIAGIGAIGGFGAVIMLIAWLLDSKGGK